MFIGEVNFFLSNQGQASKLVVANKRSKVGDTPPIGPSAKTF